MLLQWSVTKSLKSWAQEYYQASVCPLVCYDARLQLVVVIHTLKGDGMGNAQCVSVVCSMVCTVATQSGMQ